MGTIDKCNQLYNDFLEEFPLESLRDMSLEKYTNLNKDSFCYWIENKTQQLGSISGGSSYKFGIYKYKKKPNNPTIIISDNEYAWYKWYNVENRDEAYKKTLDSIIKIAQVASNGKFEEIDEISTLGEVFKWKIAFLYSNKKLIPIYKKDILKEIALELGYNENLKNPTIWDLQNFLLIKKGDKDVFEYSKYLFEIKSGKIIREEENLENKFMSKCSEYIKLLEGAHNLVLTGAPGTGKTYMAREIAKEMGAEVEFVQFHPSYDYTDFVEGLRPIEKNDGQMGFERKDGVFKEFCKRAINNLEIKISNKDISFNDIYSGIVSDIKEGKIQFYQNLQGENLLLKINEKGRIEYRENSPRTESEDNIELMYNYLRKNNIFDLSSYSRDDYWNLIGKLTQNKTNTVDYVEYHWILQELLNRTLELEKSCSDIKDDIIDSKKKFVFIIDEINRGEASKIFGELFYAIDPGYRGNKKDNRVKTQYQNLIPESDVFAAGFYVPENVYILATMNDIDRSVESMDFAMRRRFTWKEVTPTDTESMLDKLSCASSAKERMRWLNKEIAKVDGLGEAYMIGPAYFLKLEKYNNDFEQLWEMHLCPLLKEYLRGFRNAQKTLEKLKEAYDGKVKEEANTENTTTNEN